MCGLEDHGNGRADVHFAFQLDAGVVDAGNVLDDGQPQTGAAGRLASALVHAVEPFKNAGLGFFWNADAVVLHGQGTVAVPRARGDELNLAAGVIVADGVVAQVLAQLIQQAAAAKDRGTFADVGQGDEGLLRVDLLALDAFLGNVQQIDRLHLGRIVAFGDVVQMGQLQNIVDQLDHPAGFYMDLPAKLRHIGGSQSVLRSRKCSSAAFSARG